MFGRSPSYNLDYIGCHVSLLSRSLQPHRIDVGAIVEFLLAINKSILHRPFYQLAFYFCRASSNIVEPHSASCGVFSCVVIYLIESIYALISPPHPFVRTIGVVLGRIRLILFD